LQQLFNSFEIVAKKLSVAKKKIESEGLFAKELISIVFGASTLS
jgi:hypothetical protein